MIEVKLKKEEDEPVSRKRRLTNLDSDQNSDSSVCRQEMLKRRKNEFDLEPDETVTRTTRYGRQSRQPVKYTDPVKSRRQLKEEEKNAKKEKAI